MATIYEQAQNYLDTQMKDPLRAMLMGRKLFAKVTRAPEGTFNCDYWKVTEMGGAIITYSMNPGEYDSVALSTTNLKVPVIAKGYEMSKSDLMAFANKGTDLTTVNMMSAMQVVGLAEDDLLLAGWKADGTNYDVEGLGNITGATSESTSKDFGTYGYPTAKLALIFAALTTASVPVNAYNGNMILHPTQYYELDVSKSTAGVEEMPQVLRMLQKNPGLPAGSVFMSSDVTAGTAILAPVDPFGTVMDLFIAMDTQNHLGYDSKLGEAISPVFGTVIEAVRPRIFQPAAICVATGC